MLKLLYKRWKNDRKIRAYYKRLERNWINEIKSLAKF
jgi:hypothetical protein